MAILRFLLKIPAIPLMLICRIITVGIDLAAKVSCLVLGPITVFILGCVVYTICKDVKSIRQQSLMSQEAFAQAIGVSFTTVNRWETGKCKTSYKTIKQLSEFCKENDIAIDITKNFIGEGGKNE